MTAKRDSVLDGIRAARTPEQEQAALERLALSWWNGLSESDRRRWIRGNFGTALIQEQERRRAARGSA